MRLFLLSLVFITSTWALDEDALKFNEECVGFALDRILSDGVWKENTDGPMQQALKWSQPLAADWDVYYRLAVVRDLWVLANTGNPPKAHAADTDGITDAKAPSAEWTKILQFSIMSISGTKRLDETVRSKLLAILTRHRARPFASRALFPTDQKLAFPGGAPTGAPKALESGYYDYNDVVSWLRTDQTTGTSFPVHQDRLIALLGSDAHGKYPNIVVGKPSPDMPLIGLQVRVWKEPNAAATVASSYAFNSREKRSFVAVACPAPTFTRDIIQRIVTTPAP